MLLINLSLPLLLIFHPMETKDVLNVVSCKSAFALEMFTAFINSEKEITKSFIKQAVLSLIEKSFKDDPNFLQCLVVRDKQERQLKYAYKAFDDLLIDELMLALEVESKKAESSMFVKIPFLRNIAIKTTALITGLDGDALIKMRAANKEEYMELGDVILLAGIYRLIADQAIVH
jgi:hypothetical protein